MDKGRVNTKMMVGKGNKELFLAKEKSVDAEMHSDSCYVRAHRVLQLIVTCLSRSIFLPHSFYQLDKPHRHLSSALTVWFNS